MADCQACTCAVLLLFIANIALVLARLYDSNAGVTDMPQTGMVHTIVQVRPPAVTVAACLSDLPVHSDRES